ncbi:hypothetical protein MMC29_002478 [Sticta canariensis]|nr:hypothetical protein [Sticta canariensis]
MANPVPTLDHLLNEYAIQTAIMQDLNFYDFRNLRLAGCQIPVRSRAVQEKYLDPIHCNEFRDTFDNRSQCGKTPLNVEMKPCQGLSVVLRPEDPRPSFEDPQISHLHDGRDKSKCCWVCTECRDRSQEQYQNHGMFMGPSYMLLCKVHSLKHEGFPSNACRCFNTAIGDWKCSMCILTSLDIMQSRALNACQAVPLHVTLLGIWAVIVRPRTGWTTWLLWKLQQAQNVLNKFIPWRVLSNVGLRRTLRVVEWSRLCPIENCRRARWENKRAMRMCLECKAVFSARNATL